MRGGNGRILQQLDDVELLHQRRPQLGQFPVRGDNRLQQRVHRRFAGDTAGSGADHQRSKRQLRTMLAIAPAFSVLPSKADHRMTQTYNEQVAAAIATRVQDRYRGLFQQFLERMESLGKC